MYSGLCRSSLTTLMAKRKNDDWKPHPSNRLDRSTSAQSGHVCYQIPVRCAYDLFTLSRFISPV